MVALITADIGNFDKHYPIPKQTVPFKYYLVNNVTDIKGSDRRKSRYPKTQGHKLFTQEALIWIDGSIRITSPNFIEYMLDLLIDKDIVAPLHPERTNTYEELEFVIKSIEDGNPYLSRRYPLDKMKGELDFVTEQKMPKDYPLLNAGIIARWNNNKLNNAFDEWWKLILKHADFDQAMFNYVCWKHNLDIGHTTWDTPHFTIGSHISG